MFLYLVQAMTLIQTMLFLGEFLKFYPNMTLKL